MNNNINTYINMDKRASSLLYKNYNKEARFFAENYIVLNT